MERLNSIAAREKRGLDSGSSVQEGQADKKRLRPALSRVIVEALKVDSLQKLCSSLEPIVRRVVGEEVERALVRLAPVKPNGGRVSPKRIEAPNGRNLHLQLRPKLSLPLFTGGRVEGEDGTAIHAVLLDISSGHIVTSGPESSAKLDIVVLEGDFNNDDEDGWSQDEFESHMVKEREGKRPLLTGDLQVTLKGGVGTLGELTFTDNSSWIRSRKFRLGLKVASGSCEGIRIREAKTDPFAVKDHRGELYKKHYPPAPNDEVWRLVKIGKDGSFHKRLNEARIDNVEKFLLLAMKDPQKLRTILGSGMSKKMWDVLLEHSKTCVLSGKHYVYYPDELKNVGVVFNNSYELSGLIAGGQYHSVDSLSESQKDVVDTLVKKAYDDWTQVVEYDSKSLLGLDQKKGAAASQNDPRVCSQDQPSTFNQLGEQRHPSSVSSERISFNPVLSFGGYGNNNVGTHYPAQSLNLNVSTQLDGMSFAQYNQLSNSTQQNHQLGNDKMLTLGLPLPTVPSFHTAATPSFTSFKGFEDINVDDIRVRSNEMLYNDDMQHLLRMFNMGGHGHDFYDDNENTYTYSAYAPNMHTNFSFDGDRARSSGKAVVGWLKLKAALRWGIFIRKKAAERRARIEELDDY